MLITLRAIVVLLSFFFAQSFAESHYPLTVKDGLGYSMTLTEQPSRISSKTMFSDEVLLSMIDSAQFTSITNLATDPTYSLVANQLPANVPTLAFNVESIIQHSPDIVFAANWSDAGKVTQLRQMGITVYLIDTPNTMDQIQAQILRMGQILNRSEQAAGIVQNMNKRLQAVSDSRAQNQKSEWVTLDFNSWGASSGLNTTWQAVLHAAGLINGAAQFEQGAFGQVPMSKELIIDVNPDILFVPGWPDDHEKQGSFLYQVVNDPALANVKAIKNKRVYPVPEALRGTYSQYVINTVEYVVNAVNQPRVP